MIVGAELDIAVADDIPTYATAHRVRRLVVAALRASDAIEPRQRKGIEIAATGLTVLAVEALRAVRLDVQLARLRQASLVLEILRHDAWSLLCRGALSTVAFDEIMIATTRCAREIGGAAARARHRAWAQLHGTRPPA